MPAAILVGLVWVASFIDGLVTQEFLPLEITTPVVMIAAGAVFMIQNGRNH